MADDDISQYIATLPKMRPYAGSTASAPAPSSPIVAGLKSGGLSALSSLQSGLGVAYQKLGINDVSIPGTNYQLGASDAFKASDATAAAATAAGRPDIEARPFFGEGSGGLSGFLGKAAYTGARMVPGLAAGVAGGIGGAALLPEVAAGGAAGVGLNLLRGTIGAAGVGIPAEIGSFAKAARDQNNGQLSDADANKAIALGVPLGLLGAFGGGVDNAFLKGGIEQALSKEASEKFAGSTARRVAYGAMAQGAVGGVSSALDTAAETSFDPNMTPGERAQRMLQAGASGAVVGGLFGGAFGILHPNAPIKNIDDATAMVDPSSQSTTSAQPTDQLGGQMPPDMPAVPTQDQTLSELGGQMPPDMGRVPTLDQTLSELGGRAPADLPDRYQQRGAEQLPLDLRMRFEDRHEGFQPNLFDQGDAPPAVLGQAPAPGQEMATPPTQPLPDSQLLARMQAAARAKVPVEAQQAGELPQSLEDVLAQLHEQPMSAVDTAANGGQPVDLAADPAAATRAAADEASGTQDNLNSQTLFQQFGDRDGAIGQRGIMRDFINSTKVSDDADLYNKLKAELDSKSKVSRTAGFKSMAQEVGLLGEDNNPFDLDAERADAASLPNARARAAAQAQVEAVAERMQRAQALREPAEPAAPNTSGDQLGGQEAADALPSRSDYINDALQTLRGKVSPDDPTLGTPRGDVSDVELRRRAADQAAIGRDRAVIERMFGGRRADDPPAIEQPKSMADRVTDAAHELTGGTGGSAKIADIRAKLPDVAREDIDDALKKIHGDDTDNTLTQAPKGQRKDVDGVTVPGQGKFHNLTVEPREEPRAVQERSTEVMGGGERSGSGEDVVRRDGAEREAAAAQSNEGRAEVARTPAEGEAGARATKPEVEPDTHPSAADDKALAASREIKGDYPGTRAAAARLGIEVPENAGGEALTAVDQRLQRMWSLAKDGKFGDEYHGLYRDAQATYGGKTANMPRTPDGELIRHSNPLTEQTMVARRRAAGLPEPSTNGSKTGKALTSKALKPRVSNQTSAGRAINDRVGFERYRQGLKLSDDVTNTTPKDLVDQLRQPKDTIPTPDETVKPLLRHEVEETAPIANSSADDVRGWFKDATAKLSPDIQAHVHLVDKAADLPVAVRDQLRVQGYDPEKVPALIHRGEVYLQGDKLGSRADVEEMIAHEVIGHMGTSKQLAGTPEGRIGTLAKAFDSAGGTDGIIKIAKQMEMYDTGNTGLKYYLDRLDLNNLTTNDKATLVDELIAHGAQSNAFTTSQKSILAFIGRVKQALAASFRKAGLDSFATKFEKFGLADVQRFLADSKDLVEGRPQQGTVDLSKIPDARLKMLLDRHGDLLMPSLRAPNREQDVHETLDDAKGVSRLGGVLQQMTQRLPMETLSRVFRKARYDIMTRQDLERAGGKDYPEFHTDGQLVGQQQNVTHRVGQFHAQHLNEHYLLKRTDGKLYDDYNRMVQNASINNLDPTKSRIDPARLQGVTPEQAVKLQGLQDELYSSWQRFGSIKKDDVTGRIQSLYNNSQAGLKANQLLQNINRLHDVARLSGESIPGFERNAVANFETRSDLHTDPNAANAFARAELIKLTDAMQSYLTAGRTGQTVDPQMLDIIKGRLDQVRDSVTRMDTSPYTNLGRRGDHFVKFAVKRAVDGTPDPASMEVIRSALDKAGFADAQFNSIGDNPAVFMRLQSLENAKAVADLVGGKFNAKGVREGGLSEHLDTQEELRSGTLLNEADWRSSDVGPELQRTTDRLKEKLKDNPVALDAALKEMRGLYFDTLPDNANVKMQAHRMDVNGYSGDMLKNNALNIQIAANAIGRGLVRDARVEATAGIMKRARDAQTGETYKATQMSDLAQAFIARNAAESTRVPSGLFDKLRGFAHSFYLAASPGYVIMQGAQTYTLTMPELAKHFGYQSSMTSLAATAKDVGTVLAAMARVQAEHFGAMRRGETPTSGSGISARALEIAKSMGMSLDKIEFLRTLDNMGKLEMGTFARENFAGLDSSARSSTSGKVLQMLNSTATNAELSARLVAAFSAKRLHDNASAQGKLPSAIARKYATVADYAGHVVSESMYEWGSSQTSRLFSKAGPLGAATPLVTQFHGFGTRLFGKLYQETYNAFKGDTPEERTEARRFMMAHLTATASLAGTMGLPAAAWAAAAITKASTLMPGSGGEAYDVNAHMQHFVEGIIGKGATGALLHGLPRLVNADFSDLGDKDLLPATELLEDRRKMEDSIPDYLMKAWGSSIGAGVSGVMGARDIMNGDVMRGLARVLPTAMKDGFKAYQISEHGYTDSAGNKLPISSDAVSVLKQALGIQSGDVADYRERKSGMVGAKEDRQFHSGVIKRNIAVALENGDTDSYEHWMEEAQKYDQDPRHAGMPMSGTIGSYIASRARARAFSQSTGLPLGTSPTDLPAYQFYR